MNFDVLNQTLPPGLMDRSVEFYTFEQEIWCLYNSQKYHYNDFPAEVLQVIDADMSANQKAQKALYDLDITDLDERRKQYIACRFGRFDSTPDISDEGILQNPEYVDCGMRGGICPHEGKLCSSIVLEFGVLTPREIEVLQHIGRDLLDKEICDVLKMANDTLRTHKDNISAKNGSSRKSALAKLAYKYHLT